ncbi:AraC family transcriptional regulator [Lampropedia aestuarii]|uniref:AraC family transcriptional regulator n=1 Tax=Lampropedia aestuarii TaxID=2562762 RepID=A0A4S5BR74_9BURK|nr:AraC family transcriptional regulator [Lampropedia aestuarii]THJ33683.1 AraC family transcriptional regulator [Lampropedia aestuarii]
MRQPVFTAPIFAVHGLLDGARGKGLATPEWLADVLGRAGISASLLELEESRVTVEQFNTLLIAVKDSLNDECLGYLHGRPLRPGSFALMVRSAFSANSLELALRRLAESFALLQDDVALLRVTEGALSGIALDMRGGSDAYADFLHAHLLRVFWRLLVWLHGGRLVPQRFDFSFAPPPHAQNYQGIFSGTLCFGQPRTAVWFDSDAFKQPVRRDRDVLQSFLRATPGNVVGPYLNERSASARVRMVLQRASPEWPDLASTAQHLHMSVSALQRHLASEGTSFQALKDQLRRDVAIVRLTSSDASLVAIAADLGFSDSTAFQRAFKVWTGSAPGAYRARSRTKQALA